MKKLYYLKTCSTCIRIMNELDLNGVELINIKEKGIKEADLVFAAEKTGSFAALFSKRAMKYRSLGLNEKELTEDEMKKWILEEYTFLKRPMALIDGEVFVGSTKKNVEALKEKLNG